MYHYTSDPPADADIYRTDLSVSPAALRQQLAWLRDNGYTAITLDALVTAAACLHELPPRPIILTFDDGYRDNYAVAFPLLQEFGMVGTFFIVTDFVESGNENYMSWEMVAEMAAAGMRMENHTRTHPNLAQRSPEEVRAQVQGAQEALARHTGVMPRFLAWPGGFFDQETVALVRDLDLWGAVTTRHGQNQTWHERYELKRLRMRYTTTLPILSGMLNDTGQ
jgi:peptidoglycan/xylan/chitin deacetylase (PgdA/CDA1 family)